MSANLTNPRRNEYIDLSFMRTVPVIASFNARGDCVPVYFRYIFSDGTYSDIAIDRVIMTDKRFRQTCYVCDVTVNDARQRVTFTYFRDDGMWALKTN
ncbi:hypothetical protein [Lacrimispora sp.]|uniref:hypothetical protein n=1 Tax=Lacrimispora sp. TaxID=2719234 RepID=UPI0034600BE7